MPLQQAFRPDQNLVYSRIAPTLDADTLRRWAIDTFRDPRYRAAMRELLDLRGVRDVAPDLGFGSVRSIYQIQRTWIANLRGRAPIVLVAPGDLIFGLARIYASLASQDGLQARPLRDWDTACRLLDLDPGDDLAARAAEA